jgi:hypothetical protein
VYLEALALEMLFVFKFFRFRRDLHIEWPESLSVKDVYLEGRVRGETIFFYNVLRQNTPVKGLELIRCPTSLIYTSVENLGANVKNLLIKGSSDDNIPLDVYRVLSFCPELRSFYLRDISITENAVFVQQVSPNHFQYCRR